MNKLVNYIKNHKAKCTIMATLILIFAIWMIWSNLSIQVNSYTVYDEQIPSSFDDFRIAQVSDLHNAEFGINNAKLIEKLRISNPDIIVITGDTVDNFHTDTELALNFLEQAIKIAPCYYITGNHEAWIGRIVFSDFEDKMLELGVIVLHGESMLLEKEGACIVLAGVDDPDYSSKFSKSLSEMSTDEYFTVLLSHRPERFEEYVDNGYDLVLSGHAHGGQFRLPFVGGLLAPNQGWFPKYDSGLYAKDNTTMIVSRGIGNSVVPIRINNRPELIIIELNNDNKE